jgi:hypothetical protein
VVYKPADQTRRTEVLVQLAIDKITEAGEYVVKHYSHHSDCKDWALRFAYRVASAMGRIMVAHAATLKGPEFAAEKEWRLVNLGVTAVDGSIPTGPLLRTYYEFPFVPAALQTVFIGRAQADINRPVAEKLLNERGFDKTRIKRGKVELRVLS